MPDVLPPADWFPDPTGRHQQRYWDGSAWTEHVFTDGTQGVDPLDAPAAPSEGTDVSDGTTAADQPADLDTAAADVDTASMDGDSTSADGDSTSAGVEASSEEAPAQDGPVDGAADTSAAADDRAGWFLLSTDTTPAAGSAPATDVDDPAQDSAGNAPDETVGSTLGETQDRAAEVADEAQDAVGSTLDDAQQVAGTTVGGAGDAVGAAADGAADAAGAAVDDAIQGLDAALEDVADVLPTSDAERGAMEDTGIDGTDVDAGVEALDDVTAGLDDASATAADATEELAQELADTSDDAATASDAASEAAAQAPETLTDTDDPAAEPAVGEPASEEPAEAADSGVDAAGLAAGVAGGAAAAVAASSAGTADADAPPADTPAWVASPPPTVPVSPVAGTGGITGALVDGAYGEQDSDEPAALQNSRLLRCHLNNSTVLARQGTMVAYQGKVDFAYEGAGGLGRAVKRAATGEGVRMMRVSGGGDVFFADEGKHVFLLHLDGQSALSVNGRSILAFSDTLQWSIERVQGATLLSGGLFNTTLRGTGWVALVSDGEPVVLRTEDAPTFADVNALVAWSAGLQTKVVSSVKVGALAGFGSGEAVQMQFTGAGIVVIQPSEGRTAVAT